MYEYRILQGKQGISGHVRSGARGQQVVIRGLPPGEICHIYWMEAEENRACMRHAADQSGILQADLPGKGDIFVQIQNRVVLWEGGDDATSHYFRACAWLDRLNTRENARAEEQNEKDIVPAAEKETLVISAEEQNDLIAPKTELTAPSHETEMYSLRPESSTGAVDDLPRLLWPRSIQGLQRYFDRLPPFAPLDAPGWRFVRVPSPLRGTAYCAVGYFAQDDRVTQIAYAIPGNPYRAPADLAGYRYRMGRNGQGYWVMDQRLENKNAAGSI